MNKNYINKITEVFHKYGIKYDFGTLKLLDRSQIERLKYLLIKYIRLNAKIRDIENLINKVYKKINRIEKRKNV